MVKVAKSPSTKAVSRSGGGGAAISAATGAPLLRTGSGGAEAEEAASDFGGMVNAPPRAVFQPRCAADVSRLVAAALAAGLPLAARGNGHSVHGQPLAPRGLVLSMRRGCAQIRVFAPPPNRCRRRRRPSKARRCTACGANCGGGCGGESGAECGAAAYVEAGGGALWIDVLRACLQVGMAPKSWTDYLNLTIGGTLSNAGVSGQAFRHGPQISNVLQMEVVTGTGDIVTCSPKTNPELYFAVLGGLGQFGIITKARIPLEQAPERVQYVRLLYADFDFFKNDMELLISRPEDSLVDYVEGNVVLNAGDTSQGWASVPFAGQKVDASRLPDPSTSKLLYCLELAKYYSPDSTSVLDLEESMKSLLGKLSNIHSLVYKTDVSYFDFLNRVSGVEEKLKKIGLWDVPHPWLILFVPAASISKFNDLVLQRLLTAGVNGPLLVYPMNKSKWETRCSAIVPEGGSVFYMVGLLRYVLPSGGESLQGHLQHNAEILNICEAAGLGVKQYFPSYSTEAEWKRHFGASWGSFCSNKLKFDPHAILCPGQKVFQRGPRQ